MQVHGNVDVSQFRKAEIYVLDNHYADASPISPLSKYIVNTEHIFLSILLIHLLTFLSFYVAIIFGISKHRTIEPQKISIMPFPPPPTDTIGTVPPLQASKVLADSYADWDNIGFKIREGMCEHSAVTFLPSLRPK